MKKLTHTIIFFVAMTLITAGFAPAQNVTEEENQPASKEAVAAEKEVKLEKKKAEIAAKVAQKKAEVETKVEQVRDEIARTQMEAAEQQMRAVEEQMRAAEKQMKNAEKRMALAQYQTGMDEYMLGNFRAPRVTIPHLQHSDSGAVIIIPAAEMKPEDLVTITEDMTVMSRIFDKKLSEKRLTMSAGSLFVGLSTFGRDSRTTQAIYLDGYGALFLMRVNTLLSQPPEAQQEEEKTEEEDADPLWTETKQEIYAPEEVDRRRRPAAERPEEKYDAEKVAELKETLIKTLKHAANIQTLKPDHSVILTVIGGQSRSGRGAVTQSYLYDRRSTGRIRGRTVRTAPTEAETGSFLPTVLTICAKKSDIDAFARDELSFDEFRERTSIFTSYAKFTSEGLPVTGQKSVAQVQVPVF